MSDKKGSGSASGAKRFFKKQGYYILLAFCALLIATVIVLTVVFSNQQATDQGKGGGGDQITGGDENPPVDGGENPPVDGGENPPVSTPKFYAPIATEYTGYDGGYMEGSGFNARCYGLVFQAEKGSQVIASADGTVIKNGLTKGNKYVITISYKDAGMVIDYYGLDETNQISKKLVEGSTVTQNQIIGCATGKYNYAGNVLSAVHIDVFKRLADGTKSTERIKTNAIVFDESNK